MCGGTLIPSSGYNGAGRSTMLNAVAGTLTVDSGSILLDGEGITRKPLRCNGFKSLPIGTLWIGRTMTRTPSVSG